PQVVVRDGAPLPVLGAPVCRERLAVAEEGFAELALDVGQDAQVLLHPRAEGLAAAAQLERLEECPAGLLEATAGQIEGAEGVQRFRRAQAVAALPRHLVA